MFIYTRGGGGAADGERKQCFLDGALATGDSLQRLPTQCKSDCRRGARTPKAHGRASTVTRPAILIPVPKFPTILKNITIKETTHRHG